MAIAPDCKSGVLWGFIGSSPISPILVSVRGIKAIPLDLGSRYCRFESYRADKCSCSSMVEHLPCKQSVVGSNPIGSFLDICVRRS